MLQSPAAAPPIQIAIPAAPETAEAVSETMTIERSFTADLWEKYGGEYPAEAQSQYKQILANMMKLIQADKGTDMSSFAESIGVDSGDFGVVGEGDVVETEEAKLYLDRAVAHALDN